MHWKTSRVIIGWSVLAVMLWDKGNDWAKTVGNWMEPTIEPAISGFFASALDSRGLIPLADYFWIEVIRFSVHICLRRVICFIMLGGILDQFQNFFSYARIFSRLYSSQSSLFSNVTQVPRTQGRVLQLVYLSWSGGLSGSETSTWPGVYLHLSSCSALPMFAKWP